MRRGGLLKENVAAGAMRMILMMLACRERGAGGINGDSG